ncbi:UDP-3-O-(3-hydroxymyristoyl)glucosamine N-acyltransferase [Inmirania thermothiophila]|uniref:UDP-3-O-acylglucosamine N-acyltransferase n=1 Tax=Inmirania thermothiophila TaxID=1750597 RepID=A0A3N1Y057_9GAMM|nr:UDP-3-O-(3-hydroxymyristoyl)glucosamine N-acyltransferase [Inmirania thermothiophila]ROR32224.1 UDP-3-O-[3-hydroxymyristoyl] glucosamine N-acyltransferase [Inmirania thermothiophila]
MAGRTLGELAAHVGAELRGDPGRRVEAAAPLDRAGPRDLAFLGHPRFRRHLAATRAAAVILAPEHAGDCPVAALLTANPYLAWARALALLHPEPPPRPGVHPRAVVAEGARLGAGVSVGPCAVVEAGAELGDGVVVGPGCVVGREARIGPGSRLVANVTLGPGVILGARVLVHPGAVIGADGFGFARDGERWVRIPQLGTVRIGDDVEIGANTTIDRGALEDTVIEEGCKLDNQIQVAHNCHIGAHTAIAGCVGIAGSTRIGRRCRIGGGVGITGHLEIADDVQITAMSMVTGSIREPGVYSSGTPLEANPRWRRNAARFTRLDELARRVQALERALGGRRR